MDHQPLIILAALALVAVAAVVGRMIVRTRRAHPHAAAPPRQGARGTEEPGAERDARGERRSRLEIRSPFREEMHRFLMVWRAIQLRFVEDPRTAVTQADRLLGEVLDARGLPLGEIEAYAEDISIDFPRLVKSYRLGRATALRHARGETSTEELRQAFVAYRVMFEDLLELHEPTAQPHHR